MWVAGVALSLLPGLVKARGTRLDALGKHTNAIQKSS